MKNDLIKYSCEKCKYHKELMCDADQYASFCTKKKMWCENVDNCSKTIIKRAVTLVGDKIFKSLKH